MTLKLDTKQERSAYAAAHMWMRYHYGKPQKCDHCATTEKRMYHWANISGTYKRERMDWLRLCVPCHKNYDIKALGGKIRARPVKQQPSKVCVNCGNVFFKNPHFSGTQWVSKSTCGRKCRGLVDRQKTIDTRPSKHCLECQAEYFKETWQSRSMWAGRQYCGRKCGSLVSARLRTGEKQSDETRDLKSEKLRQRWQNPEWRERISTKMLGNQHAKKA